MEKRLESLPLRDIRIEGGFWGYYTKLLREAVLPYQWEVLNGRVKDRDSGKNVWEPLMEYGTDGGIFERKRPGGDITGFAKWLEGACFVLTSGPDRQLEKMAEEAVAHILMYQDTDGYIGRMPKEMRWKNLREVSELYVAGHIFEAGVAYYEATGKDDLLKACVKLADLIDSLFGVEEGKLRGYPGHPEKRYLSLSRYFITERGKEPYYFDLEAEKRDSVWQLHDFMGFGRTYLQAHKPMLEQDAAEGHAVRATYLYSGIADIASAYGDETLNDVARAIWEDLVNRRMYITGGVGSAEFGERFSFDYDLPNDVCYCETCASIGLAMFGNRMAQTQIDASYADVVEKALLNTLLAGVSRNGTEYFYCNPLEVWPEAVRKNPSKRCIWPVRQQWFRVACCPPNVARTLASLGTYAYAKSDDTVYINQFVSGSVSTALPGARAEFTVETNYPWDGKVTIRFLNEDRYTLAVRVPGWCKHFDVSRDDYELKNGYLHIRRERCGQELTFSFEMPVVKMKANPLVRADAGKTAIMRGPLVYCLEGTDNGENLSAITLNGCSLHPSFEDGLFSGITVIEGEGCRDADSEWSGGLYQELTPRKEKYKIKAIPYFLWANRGENEMEVWIRD